MSTLGDEIRAQQRSADALAAQLHQHATDLRTRMNATDWISTSANSCRHVVTGFAARIDARADEAKAFSGDIAHHATSVEHNEEMAKTVALAALALTVAPTVALAHAAESAGSTVGHALHRPESEGSFGYSYPGDWRG